MSAATYLHSIRTSKEILLNLGVTSIDILYQITKYSESRIWVKWTATFWGIQKAHSDPYKEKLTAVRAEGTEASLPVGEYSIMSKCLSALFLKMLQSWRNLTQKVEHLTSTTLWRVIDINAYWLQIFEGVHLKWHGKWSKFVSPQYSLHRQRIWQAIDIKPDVITIVRKCRRTNDLPPLWRLSDFFWVWLLCCEIWFVLNTVK